MEVYYCDFSNRFVIFNGKFYITYDNDNRSVLDAFYRYGMKLTYIGVL